MSFRERGIRDEDFGVPPSHPDLGMTPRLVMRTEADIMAKAEKNGTYTLEVNGETATFFVAEGDELPEGATFQADKAIVPAATDEAPTTRNKGAAPENRSA